MISVLLGVLLCLQASVGPAAEVEAFPTSWATFDYPIVALQANLEGQVVLDITFSKSGQVDRVDRISGSRLLGEHASSAIGKWRFAARCAGPGVPESIKVRMIVDFKIEGSTRQRPITRIQFAYPDHIEVVSQAPLVQPTQEAVSGAKR